MPVISQQMALLLTTRMLLMPTLHSAIVPMIGPMRLRLHRTLRMCGRARSRALDPLTHRYCAAPCSISRIGEQALVPPRMPLLRHSNVRNIAMGAPIS